LIERRGMAEPLSVTWFDPTSTVNVTAIVSSSV
jgi:hypothetical protein